MKICEKIEILISTHLDEEFLDDEEIKEMEEHLKNCAHCCNFKKQCKIIDKKFVLYSLDRPKKKFRIRPFSAITYFRGRIVYKYVVLAAVLLISFAISLFYFENDKNFEEHLGSTIKDFSEKYPAKDIEIAIGKITYDKEIDIYGPLFEKIYKRIETEIKNTNNLQLVKNRSVEEKYYSVEIEYSNKILSIFFKAPEGQILLEKKIPFDRELTKEEIYPYNFEKGSSYQKEFGNKTENQEIEITIGIDKGEYPVYYNGEKMIVEAKTSRDCYLNIFYIKADEYETTLQIFPNDDNKNSFVKAKETYSIPIQINSINKLGMSIDKLGMEFLMAFASDKELPNFPSKKSDRFRLISTNPLEIVKKMRKQKLSEKNIKFYSK